jgi:hypothetical protein
MLRSNLFFLLLAGFALLLVSTASSATVTTTKVIKVSVDADSYVDPGKASSNFGKLTWARAGTGRRALFQFTSSSVPANSKLTAATLSVYTQTFTKTKKAGYPVVYAISSNWNENKVTAKNQPTAGKTSVLSGKVSPTAAKQWLKLPINALSSIKISGSSLSASYKVGYSQRGATWNIATKEAGANYQAYLTLTFRVTVKSPTPGNYYFKLLYGETSVS